MRIALQWMDGRCVVEGPDSVVGDVGRLFSPLAASPPGPDVQADVRVVPEGENNLVVALSTEPCLGHTDTVSAVELAVTRALMAKDERHAHLHAAGALAPSGRCVLAVGPSGSGKSTTAYAWYRMGTRLLGDDVIGIDEAGVAHAFPRPLKVDGARLRDAGENPEETPAWDPRAVEAWVEPDRHGGWATVGAAVDVIAEIRYDPQLPTRVEPATAREGLALLLSSLHPSGTAKAEALDRLIRAVEGADLCRVRFRSAEEAARLLLERATARHR